MAIMLAEVSGQWTMTEAARLLEQPQHRLIYLCEKGVVEPDFQNAEGRGSSRRFSARNLLEFAVALRLRELELPASFVASVLYVLRAFERSMKASLPQFRLPESLREANAPELRVIVGDGQRLFFSLRAAKVLDKVYGGIDLREVRTSKKSIAALERELAQSGQKSIGNGVEKSEDVRHARLEVSITAIAKDLKLQS